MQRIKRLLEYLDYLRYYDRDAFWSFIAFYLAIPLMNIAVTFILYYFTNPAVKTLAAIPSYLWFLVGSMLFWVLLVTILAPYIFGSRFAEAWERWSIAKAISQQELDIQKARAERYEILMKLLERQER